MITSSVFSRRFTTSSTGDNQVDVLSYTLGVLKVRLPTFFFDADVPLEQLLIAVGESPVFFISMASVSRDDSDTSNYVVDITLTTDEQEGLASTPTQTFVQVTKLLPSDEFRQQRNFSSVTLRTEAIEEALDKITNILQSLQANKVNISELDDIISESIPESVVTPVDPGPGPTPDPTNFWIFWREDDTDTTANLRADRPNFVATMDEVTPITLEIPDTDYNADGTVTSAEEVDGYIVLAVDNNKNISMIFDGMSVGGIPQIDAFALVGTDSDGVKYYRSNQVQRRQFSVGEYLTLTYS